MLLADIAVTLAEIEGDREAYAASSPTWSTPSACSNPPPHHPTATGC